MASKVTLGGELLFPNDYVAAVEFKGKDVTLTIVDVKREELRIRGGKSEVKPIIYFRETKKKLVCNKTNADSIATMYGDKADDWIGKRVTLYPTKTPCGRDMVDCIRVREKIPGGKASPPSGVDPDTGEVVPTPEELGEQLPLGV